jgi:hypothetical protein
MATTWLIVIGIVIALGWLYFSAKLRTLRLRVPPAAVPTAGDPPPPDRGIDQQVSDSPSSG